MNTRLYLFDPRFPRHTQCLHLLRMVDHHRHQHRHKLPPTVEHVRPDDSDEHVGSKKLKLSEPGSLPSGAPMSADVNLSSDDMRVECLLERFERERVAFKSNTSV